jgi:hypothetical protein
MTINGANIVVKLCNLSINGQFTTGRGVFIQDAAAVIIENCAIQNFRLGGIFVQTSNAFQLNVADTLIANNTAGLYVGIVILRGGKAPTSFALDRLRIENNINNGIMVEATSANGVVTGIIRDTMITGSTNGSGLFALTNVWPVTVSLDHTHVANNSIGILSQGGAAVILNNSTIQTNGTGLNASGGGAIFSYGNNPINGNQPGGIGTAPIVIGLH